MFKTSVTGKSFVLSDLSNRPFSVSLARDPQEGLALRAEFEQIRPGSHLNEKHWITVVLDGAVPDDLAEQLLRSPVQSRSGSAAHRHRPSAETIASARGQ